MLVSPIQLSQIPVLSRGQIIYRSTKFQCKAFRRIRAVILPLFILTSILLYANFNLLPKIFTGDRYPLPPSLVASIEKKTEERELTQRAATPIECGGFYFAIACFHLPNQLPSGTA